MQTSASPASSNAGAAFDAIAGGARHWEAFNLQLNGNGKPHANANNATRILIGSRYAGCIWYDVFYQRIRTSIGGRGVQNWSDAHDADFQIFCQRDMGIPQMSIEAIRQAVLHVAHADLRSEPAEWLRTLKWDGIPRLVSLMTRGFGASDTEYAVTVGENFLKSCVARIETPGCKVDSVLILEGEQGIGKSRGVEIIGGPWYGALHSSIGSKDLLQEISGKLVCEFAELEGLAKRQVETLKAFVTRRVDTFRPPYGRHSIDVPRQVVFVATTNEFTYLRDSSGARRFLPVRCGKIDLEWLCANRSQLFAEAAARIACGERWWDFPVDETEREQEMRYADDPWSDPIEHFLIGRQMVSIVEILSDAVKIETGRQDKAAQMRAARVLERAGWRRQQLGASRRRVWIAPDGGSGGSNVVRMNVDSNQRLEPQEPPEHKVNR